MVVPGGGPSLDGSKWIASRPNYFLTVEVLSALFRRLFLQMLVAAPPPVTLLRLMPIRRRVVPAAVAA
jgi:hypothetical protein